MESLLVAPKQMPWFRFYVEMMSDPKIRRLSPAQRWLWAGVLSAARKSPIPGFLLISEREAMDDAALADFVGVPLKLVTETMPVFATKGMIERDHELDAWWVPKFNTRQYESDNSTERVKRHRSKNVDVTANVTANERSENVSVAPPDTEADTDTKAAASEVVAEPTPPAHPAAAADLIDQALTLIARRRLNGKTIDNPGGYLRNAVTGLRNDHATALALVDLEGFTTPQQVADWLEPPAAPAPPDPYDLRQRAERERADRSTDPCPAGCDHGFTDRPNGTVAICPTCQGKGVAA